LGPGDRPGEAGLQSRRLRGRRRRPPGLRGLWLRRRLAAQLHLSADARLDDRGRDDRATAESRGWGGFWRELRAAPAAPVRLRERMTEGREVRDAGGDPGPVRG